MFKSKASCLTVLIVALLIPNLVDNVSMLEKFFTKRKSVYKKEGWSLK